MDRSRDEKCGDLGGWRNHAHGARLLTAFFRANPAALPEDPGEVFRSGEEIEFRSKSAPARCCVWAERCGEIVDIERGSRLIVSSQRSIELGPTAAMALDHGDIL